MREMKDSGIEWIGEIPKEWEVIPHKYVMHKEKSICEHYDREDIISLTMNGVIVRDLTAGGKMPTTFDGYQYVEPNDLLLCLFDIDVTPRCVGIVRNYGVTSPAYSRFKVHKGYHNAYYDYLLRFIDNDKVFIHLSKNLRSSLTETDFGAIKTIVPPLDVQKKIALYLDEELARVDAVIEKTKMTIEAYKKLKQSVITEAVTKGIRGDRPMKDSGIEWIGDISVAHPLKKLKYVCQILDQYRSPVTADRRSQEGEVLYDYYGASGVIDQIDGYTIDDHVMLIGEDGANLRMRNLPLMYEVNGRAWINNHAHVLKPNENIDFYYLFYALESLDINPYITGSAQPKLSQDSLKNIYIPMPSFEEQREISSYLSVMCDELDKLIADKTHLLGELKNYKKSVIYEYVTGKKEVQ